MSSLQYYAYSGLGEWARKHLNYSQAVRIGDQIQCSGQGGWQQNLSADGLPKFPTSIDEEIVQAFSNVDLALKDAGGKGWSQVFRVNSYHIDLTPEVTGLMVENFRKWMPDHMPIWTQVGVRQLGADGMNVEIEVVAYDPAQ
ncbi:hypothetical protein LTS08_001882 [Lithohypha guttulata]|uniref:Uncharacterized protein n=1 Tax=Lithohypha guttulata TaxID=1690604 RepID=A0AAN7SXE3_9EURO|nr:hypothetical protein LTR51_003434 [Lithohypha guttulata]KAK5084212.1 hypothetical protein LTR05_005288 [Lithohypha guttulata]KAK5105605.1 hypothetical protein LTS08_001882 [Lithohypha guttulata]